MFKKVYTFFWGGKLTFWIIFYTLRRAKSNGIIYFVLFLKLTEP